MNLRPVIFWSHLAAGVTAGLVILVMSVTGTLLMYERQLVEWSDRGYRSEAPPGVREPLPVETLLERVREQRPGEAPTAVALRSDPAAPAAITFGKTTLYADVYTGHVLGEPSTDVRRVMTELRSWHRWMSLDGDRRALGKSISGWSNAVFLAIVISGMYLWMPRKWSWKSVRAITVFRGGLRGKARDFNWHNVIGIWSAVPLAIVVATAMPISFRWANALVYTIAGESVPAPAGGGEGAAARGNVLPTGQLNALWRTAEAQMPAWRSISLRLPGSVSAPVVFAMDSGTGGQPQHRATLTLDASTGAVVRWETFGSQSLGRRLRSWTRFTHTGEYYGLAGQTIAGLASLGGVFLVGTGLALAWRRFYARFLAANTLRARDDAARAA
jgi:uncharacterized iron-regulated membrane protein